jgi:DNA-binding transcriptional regulator YiaG
MQTFGDQLKRKRYDQRLLQCEVAIIFGVSEDTVRNWETGNSFPQLKYYPKIITFLGFNPFLNDQNLSEGLEFKDYIFRFRRVQGINCEEFGMMLGVDPTTIWSWEKGHSKPSKKAQMLVLKKISEITKSMTKSTNQL